MDEKERWTEIEKETDRDIEQHTWIYRETDRQTDRQTSRQRDKQTEIDRADMDRQTQTHRERDRQRQRQAKEETNYERES